MSSVLSSKLCFFFFFGLTVVNSAFISSSLISTSSSLISKFVLCFFLFFLGTSSFSFVSISSINGLFGVVSVESTDIEYCITLNLASNFTLCSAPSSKLVVSPNASTLVAREAFAANILDILPLFLFEDCPTSCE
ncbi:hypothetical protein ALC62_12348 [Cyphomyrmex costatus]|uniref:Uncharacterized protein n=1 Tax=Cyphomyrmex costatus TaxID=456900 RepID=A0A151IBH3_9HYME|nr:hypothetical protein ALC62_12348 [Cyphomyrmex costatus]